MRGDCCMCPRALASCMYQVCAAPARMHCHIFLRNPHTCGTRPRYLASPPSIRMIVCALSNSSPVRVRHSSRRHSLRPLAAVIVCVCVCVCVRANVRQKATSQVETGSRSSRHRGCCPAASSLRWRSFTGCRCACIAREHCRLDAPSRGWTRSSSGSWHLSSGSRRVSSVSQSLSG